MVTSGPSLSAVPVAASTSCAEILVRLPVASTRVELVAKAACSPLQHDSGHQCGVSQTVPSAQLRRPCFAGVPAEQESSQLQLLPPCA